ncbi:hypothetical protein BpHYR1_037372 [Brachionus plicatilis]|uniref:Uncharacterized protein n=1 Tax=Brachionus plicatilis TaxID=10195 RepID=A0A3M7S4S7_BRAPC|nr:hypothetical protein BpHYR1_037372 [Brachionus plicatilis]
MLLHFYDIELLLLSSGLGIDLRLFLKTTEHQEKNTSTQYRKHQYLLHLENRNTGVLRLNTQFVYFKISLSIEVKKVHLSPFQSFVLNALTY